jgi:hypothetical protein
LLQLRDAAGAAHHLAHLLQPLRVTTQPAARGQGQALLALQVGGGQQRGQEQITDRHGRRQLGGEATTLQQQRILGIKVGGDMEQHQADQGKGGGIDQGAAHPQLPGGIKQAQRQ